MTKQEKTENSDETLKLKGGNVGICRHVLAPLSATTLILNDEHDRRSSTARTAFAMASDATTTQVLVTGAASGLGRAFLEHYAALAGHKVTGIDARPWPQSAILPASARFAHVDVTDDSSVKAFLTSCDGKDATHGRMGDDEAAV